MSDDTIEATGTPSSTVEQDDLLQQTLARIIQSNKIGREESTKLTSRLVNATAAGDQDEFTRILRDITAPEQPPVIGGGAGEAAGTGVSEEEG